MKTLRDIFFLVRIIGGKGLLNLYRSKKQNFSYVRGFFASSCLSALLKTPFFEELFTNDCRIDITKFCKDYNYDEFYLKTICDYFVSLSLFESEDNTYKMKNAFHIVPSIGAYQFINAYYPIFENLADLIKKEKQYGVEVNRDDKYVTLGSSQTEKIIPYPLTKNLIKKYQSKSILDLGCGNGEFLIYVSDILSEKSYGVDISSIAVKEANTNIANHHLSERISISECDIKKLRDHPRMSPDAITLLYILHEFTQRQNEIGKIVDFLRDLKVLFPDAKLIVVESCKYSTLFLRKTNSILAEHLLFHKLSKQNLLSFQDWKNIFSESGYEILEAIELRIVGQGFFVLE